ncbi:MAG: EamA family transporter [Chloroflexi bacterium]|nr:EamA family transporter [Chloroflexota bacterium]
MTTQAQPTRADPSPLTARAELLTGAALWSSGGLFIKEIGAGAPSITVFRCLFSAVLLVPFVRGRRFPHPRDIAIAIVLFALLLGLYVGAVKETTAANAIFLQYTAPLYVIALGPWLLGERLRRQDLPTLAICLSGVLVLFLGNRGEGDALGLGMAAGSGFFYALFLLWLRRLRYADPIAVTFANCLGVTVLLAAWPGVWDVGARDLGLLALMAAFQFAVPYVLFTHGLRRVRSAEASLLALIEPVLNPIWVSLFYGEDPSTATIVGGAVIVSGLALRYTAFRAPGSDDDAVA